MRVDYANACGGHSGVSTWLFRLPCRVVEELDN